MRPILQILIAGIFLVTQSVYCQNKFSHVNNDQSQSTKLDDCYDFDELTVGDSVVSQLGGYWRTWSGEFGYGEDALVTNQHSNSPENSFVVEPDNDLVFTFDDENITSGQPTYSHQMFIPADKSGYFNFQGDVIPGFIWVVEVYFNNDGTGYVKVGNDEIPFGFLHNTWFEVYASFSLDAELALIQIDGNTIYEWENTESLGGINFYGLEGSAGAFYDDVCKNSGFEPPELFPPCELEGPTTIPPWDIELTWTAPEDCGGDWIQWDNGTNTGNGIGLTNGGTFYAAARWTPDMLEEYNGQVVTKISFYPNEDTNATFVLKAWQGDNAVIEIMSQIVIGYEVNQFNIINLANPFFIDASQELWIGYEVTHEAGTIPAGCDDGPVIQGFGDLVSIDGINWETLSSGYADNNWNIAAYAGYDISLTSGNNSGIKVGPLLGKEFSGYNVYRKFNTGSYQLIDFTTETYYSDYISVPGYWSYYVTTVYDPEGESEPSNEWIIEIPVASPLNEISQFHLYPNPATNHLTISSNSKISKLKIYNCTGELMLEKEINEQSYKLNTSEFNEGVYLFKLQTEEGEITERIIFK